MENLTEIKMKKSLFIALGTIFALGSLASHANNYSQQSSNNLDNAEAGCYVDTPAWDTPTAGRCGASGTAPSSTVAFVVLGVNQDLSQSQFTVEYLDNTCDSVNYYSQEGWVCQRTINPLQILTQRVKVTDNYTGQSKTMTARARYHRRPANDR